MSTPETLFSGDWLDVCRAEGREYMVRKICTGVAIITAVTDQHELILTEQYRVPVQSRVLELPAGMAGDEKGKEQESIEEAAKRELLEETGYEALELIKEAEGPISPGISSETMTFFFTQKVVKRHAGGGNESEDITVHTVPIHRIHEFMDEARQRGIMIDPKICMGLACASRYL